MLWRRWAQVRLTAPRPRPADASAPTARSAVGV
jgi:hypothetical protein